MQAKSELNTASLNVEESNAASLNTVLDAVVQEILWLQLGLIGPNETLFVTTNDKNTFSINKNQNIKITNLKPDSNVVIQQTKKPCLKKKRNIFLIVLVILLAIGLGTYFLISNYIEIIKS